MDTPINRVPTVYPSRSQRRILWNALTALALTALVAVSALLLYGFIFLLSWSYPILLPIGLAIIIALMLEPVVSFVQRRGLARSTATLSVCIMTVIGFLLFWAFLLPPLVSQVGDFFQSIPHLIDAGVAKLQASLTAPSDTVHLEFRGAPPSTNDFPDTTSSGSLTPTNTAAPAFTEPERTHADNAHSLIQEWLKNNLPAIQQEIQKNIATFTYNALAPVGQALGFLLGFGFVPIYVYYFLADQEKITQHWSEFVPLRRSRLRDEVVSVLAEINTSLVSYFRGQIIVAACNGVLTFLGLWAIGIPYSLVLGIITGALSIVPFLGIICSILPALLLGYLSAKGDPTWQWLRPVLVLGVFALVQMCESMFITPRVQSHSTGLHPLAIILGILFWSMLLPGLLGPVVAVPLTCAAVVLLRRYVWLEGRTKRAGLANAPK